MQRSSYRAEMYCMRGHGGYRDGGMHSVKMATSHLREVREGLEVDDRVALRVVVVHPLRGLRRAARLPVIIQPHVVVTQIQQAGPRRVASRFQPSAPAAAHCGETRGAAGRRGDGGLRFSSIRCDRTAQRAQAPSSCPRRCACARPCGPWCPPSSADRHPLRSSSNSSSPSCRAREGVFTGPRAPSSLVRVVRSVCQVV